MSTKRTPYERIMVAAAKGHQVALSADEARQMAADSNIADYAHYRWSLGNPNSPPPWLSTELAKQPAKDGATE
jgi:hypothetical protein